MSSSMTSCSYCMICSKAHDCNIGSVKDTPQSDPTARGPDYTCDNIFDPALLDDDFDDYDYDYDSDETCCGEECLEEWEECQGELEETYTRAPERRLSPFGLDDIPECDEEEDELGFRRLDLDGASLFEHYDVENPL